MPSVKVLENKKQMVADLTTKIKSSVSGVVVCYTGITVEDDTKLRTELRSAGVEYRVYKNSITSRACEEVGYSQLNDQFVGMTAIALSSEDAIAPAKILKKYADKIDTFVIKGGFIDNGVLDQDGVNVLANIPSREVLVCKIMGSMKSPLYGLAYALQAIIDKSGEAAPAPEAEAAPAPAVTETAPEAVETPAEVEATPEVAETPAETTETAEPVADEPAAE
jgi:large subunit ribosomal protein L10